MDEPKIMGTEEEREALHRQLLEQSQAGDRFAREAMIKNNMGLVWSIVRRFNNRGYEQEDLFQIGSIGLMKAIDKFDASFSVSFPHMPYL